MILKAKRVKLYYFRAEIDQKIFEASSEVYKSLTELEPGKITFGSVGTSAP